MWPDLRKSDTIMQFSNSSLYNLPSQMYALAKFDMPITFRVMAQHQSSNNKKINLFRKHLENKLQVLTKADITYEQNVTWSCNLHHCVCHEHGHLLLGKFFPIVLISLYCNFRLERLCQVFADPVTYMYGQYMLCNNVTLDLMSSVLWQWCKIVRTVVWWQQEASR